MTVSFNINGRAAKTDADPETPLLWVLRENFELSGTKFGCGIGACGACTVHVDGEPVRSCSLPISAVAGKTVTTIEGLGKVGEPHVVQAEWVTQQVPQCGYCQSGMIMAVAALLAKTPNPSDVEIDAQITNICRCGTYPRIRKAIRAIAARSNVK